MRRDFSRFQAGAVAVGNAQAVRSAPATTAQGNTARCAMAFDPLTGQLTLIGDVA